MSGQSHTPGPWEVYEDGGALEIRTALDGDVDSDTGRHVVIGGDLIAAVFDGRSDAANARLIAAAPALLEALEAARLVLSPTMSPTVCSIVDAAIAKARTA